MDLKRFEACAQAYGAGRHRWPAREHALYDRYAATPEGAAILAEAERTDRFLDAFEITDAKDALKEAISHQVSRTRSDRAPGGPVRRRVWLSAAAFAACAIFGFVIGFTQVHDDAIGDLFAQSLLGPESFQEMGL
jgi:hypothetical protein